LGKREKSDCNFQPIEILGLEASWSIHGWQLSIATLWSWTRTCLTNWDGAWSSRSLAYEVTLSHNILLALTCDGSLTRYELVEWRHMVKWYMRGNWLGQERKLTQSCKHVLWSLHVNPVGYGQFISQWTGRKGQWAAVSCWWCSDLCISCCLNCWMYSHSNNCDLDMTVPIQLHLNGGNHDHMS
jgi:hypothetical protein